MAVRHTQVILFIILIPLCLGARKSRTGELVIQSITAGAEVFVDGEKVGTIPLDQKLRLKTGRHTVRMALLGHADYIDTFKIKRGRKTVLYIDLVPVEGVIDIDASPPGAGVIIDGQMVGSTPHRATVEPGEHTLEIRSPGFLTHKQQISIDGGDRQQIDVELVVNDVVATKPTAVPWYRNHWVWVGAAGVLVTSSILIALAVTGDEKRPERRITVEIEAMR